jgi:hypothetical protein
MADDETGYPEPPAVGTEAETLVGSLERQRATLAWKCAGLDAAGLHVTVGGSSVTLGGLLKHLAYMEDVNFTRDLAGQELPGLWSAKQSAAETNWEWQSAAQDSPEALYELWASAVARSRLAVDTALRTGGPDLLYRSSGQEVSLRRLLVDMIEEYARHTGHADLIREAVDGRVGEDPPGGRHEYRAPWTPSNA